VLFEHLEYEQKILQCRTVQYREANFSLKKLPLEGLAADQQAAMAATPAADALSVGRFEPWPLGLAAERNGNKLKDDPVSTLSEKNPSSSLMQ
jgi:hypothetical protein